MGRVTRTSRTARGLTALLGFQHPCIARVAARPLAALLSGRP